VSAIEIPGLDIEERSPGTYRVRARVHPFFALTSTTSTELEAVQWGCGELGRLHALHERLRSEGQLPSKALTRAAAIELGIAHLISGDRTEAPTSVRAVSVGSTILVDEVLDTYMACEAKELTAGYFSRSKRLKTYFGGLSLASVTTEALSVCRGSPPRRSWRRPLPEGVLCDQEPRVPAEQAEAAAGHPCGAVAPDQDRPAEYWVGEA
jgi:hypothetical protein